MFMPISKEDLKKRNIDVVDFIFISGDAYVDHPSFGTAIISKVLDAFGYKVVIVAQPRWHVDDDFTQFGTPRLGFLVSSGNIDSIVNHYAVSKHRRKTDAYSEGGQIGLRPDYAVRVYSNIIRRLFPNTPIIIGGIEASLRRLGHYDYYQNKVLQSILIESNADIIGYGMGEQSIIEIAEALNSGLSASDLIYIKGTVWKTKDSTLIPTNAIYLPSFKEIKNDKLKYAKSFKIQYENTDPYSAKPLVELYDNTYVIQNTPSLPCTQDYLDWVYGLDYERAYHPQYKKGIPAIQEVKFSVTLNRGCIGSCSFCALNFHQGRIIQSRSKSSVVSEAERITQDKEFKGYIHDIGGPTANFYSKACSQQEKYGACVKKKCLHPSKCKDLNVSHKGYLEILRAVRSIKGIKKVFIRSGIRYDYLIYDKDDEFFKELVQHHISGQLKVAPEHISDKVLNYMQKPGRSVYERFVSKYTELNKKYHKEQYLVPYLMSSHPGCDLIDSIELAEYLHKNKIRVEQVQDFYPTPGTLSTCMYYTQVDPRTEEFKPLYVATSPHEKAMQRALMQYNKIQNYELVYEALIKCGRFDLIGFNEKCLIRPKRKQSQKNIQKNFIKK